MRRGEEEGRRREGGGEGGGGAGGTQTGYGRDPGGTRGRREDGGRKGQGQSGRVHDSLRIFIDRIFYILQITVPHSLYIFGLVFLFRAGALTVSGSSYHLHHVRKLSKLDQIFEKE